ncbi:helix-turn-helix domain-containing protein [Buttiauxella sp. W03-F01]|uniref:helix-turn-helix domain-containing protein n=1 Tax=Buttiauxella sp. W03-F01 TaxID=2904524 RepID=UPI00351CD7CB
MSSDWHKAEIIASLHKKGFSLDALAREANRVSSILANALSQLSPSAHYFHNHLFFNDKITYCEALRKVVR